ncbi:MAG: tRNA pseudouridine(13) synthase TruD [Methanoregula sp.]|jgi:tRNA pseudouridine13 synthase|nr:tRNA pseudouridine(13) synthase TruD [Methanoregula sp.]
MKQSTFPLERELGIHWYASDAEGIGGRLRTTAEDFLVEEIPPERKQTDGPFLICRLTKRNWELQHAVKEIAKRLGISHRRIGFAGTKDRNAITTQWISIYNVTPQQAAAVHLKDITLEPLARSNEGLSLGDLQGNRFDIVIRDPDPADLADRVRSVSETVATGVPNYFGLQRFGAIRPVTHRVGGWVLKGDYERAVLTYVGMEFPGEPDGIRAIRTAFNTTRDPVPALHALPVHMHYERAMLHHLVERPGDYAGALQVLPPKLLSMFVSAFQSYLFNLALSRRLDDGFALDDPQTGDRLLFANGRTDTVTAANAGAVRIHLKRGRCTIALFMPGKEKFEAKTAGERATEALLAEYRITPEDFERASVFVRSKFEGAWRPAAMKAEIQSEPGEGNLRLKFSLPPGHYATTVCREFMKADPVSMV